MASSEVAPIAKLASSDAQGGLALSAASGWNQTLDDWRFFIAHGHAVGCRDELGRLVGTAAALPYDGGAGWISMVLVDPAWRHRGLASRLMGECIRHLQEAGLTPTLDATPAGQGVYGQLGFAPGFAFERWEGEGWAAATGDDEVRVARPDDLDALAARDREALGGIGRAALLRDFLGRRATQAWVHANGSAFVVARAGQRATQVGPLVASTVGAALTLLGHTFARTAGRVFIDVPVRAAAVADTLAQRGFVRQRPFVRMTLGAAPPHEPHATLFALAGPEFG
ncbi:MAG TPA: GNAT family N-acetyltransferase [Caldimonas sp.]|jgi:GNAT superfamily N-acetyltransferase|nr:GNAT family N-acetyltransferase [Caldimonas sp.]HEX2543048.1 GNAT family N-acetyltransferase [Caldimonas sp.]